METETLFEFDLQLFSTMEPVGDEGGEEEEIDLPDEEIGGDPPAGAPVEDETEEEEMPDDLLSEAELIERRAQRGAQAPVARQEERSDDRDALRAELREIFGGLRQEPTQQRTEREPRQAPELQPFTIPADKMEELNQKILTEPGGIVKALQWAINFGDRRAMARIAGSTEGQNTLQASAEAFTDRFTARKLKDPSTKFGNKIEPVFQSMLDEMDLAPLASMPKADRDAWLEETWERAGFRAITRNAGTRPARSPGVARGAGGKPGGPGRGRVVVRMTEQQKKDLRAGSPQLFSGAEGEKRFLRQVWEIEHGVTSSPTVRAMTRDSMRFSDAVSFGG